MPTMAQSTNIKVVIENFCQILKLNGFAKINPEVFRQAKFDNQDATRALWRLNYEILSFFLYRNMQTKTLDDADVVLSVKSAFLHLNYKCKEFYDLPVSMENGSRELLTAFGWLIGIYDFVAELVSSMEIPVFELLSGYKGFQGATDRFANSRVADCMNTMLLIQRKHKHDIKLIRQLSKCLKKMLAKCKTSQRIDHPISVLMCMCGKQKVISLIGLLEKERALLKCYIKWFKTEDLFWQWLSSVIDEKKKLSVSSMKNENLTYETVIQNKMLFSRFIKPDAMESLAEELQHLSMRSAKKQDEILQDSLSFEAQGLNDVLFMMETFALDSLQSTNNSSESKAEPMCRLKSKERTERNKKDSLSISIEMLKRFIDSTALELKSCKSKLEELFQSQEDILRDVIHLPMPRR